MEISLKAFHKAGFIKIPSTIFYDQVNSFCAVYERAVPFNLDQGGPNPWSWATCNGQHHYLWPAEEF